MERLLKKPCKKCGGVEATKSQSCAACHRLANTTWKKANTESIKSASKQYGIKNRERINETSLVRNKTYIASLADSYIKFSLKPTIKRLNLTEADIPKELIEVKRLQLQLTRLIRA